MGILTALGKGFGGFIFSIALVLLIAQAAMVQFTSEENLKPVAVNLMLEQLGPQLEQPATEEDVQNYNDLVEACNLTGAETMPVGNLTLTCDEIRATPVEKMRLLMLKRTFETQCAQTQNETINYSLGGDAPPMRIKCAEVANATLDDVPALLAGGYFNEIYLKEWDCPGIRGYVRCLRQAENEEIPLLLLSQRTNQFAASLYTYILAALIAGIVLLVVSIRTWYKILKSVGITCLIVGLPYFLLGPIVSAFLPSMVETQAAGAGVGAAQAAGMTQTVAPLVNSVIGAVADKFLIVFIAGIVLTAAGFAGGFLQARISKERKKEVKKEKKEEKKVEKKEKPRISEESEKAGEKK